MLNNLAGKFRCFLTSVSPKLNADVVYAVKYHKFMNWNNPKSFHEKLVKLRIENYNNNPLVKKCADKYRVREYIKEKGYAFLLNKLILVCDKVEEIPWDKLPDKFVIKLNTGCGYNIICKDKNRLDIQQAVTKIKSWENVKPWMSYAEMQYKVPFKIIIEKFITNRNDELPEDYKLYCFNGKPLTIFYMTGRYTDSMAVGFFDTNWKYIGRPNKHYKEFDPKNLPPRPKSLDVMLKAAEDLSKPFPFVRMDFYDIEGQAIFGEMTFSPAGGFYASEIDINGQTMGDLLKID